MSLALAKIHPPMRGPEADSQAEPIGVRLKRLRLERGLSQRDLSSPGVSYAYISRIEAAARTPSVKALRMLARKLGVSVDYLETGRDIRDTEQRELRLTDAELALRLGEDTTAAERELGEVLADAKQAGDAVSASRAAIGLGFAASCRGAHLDAVEQLEAALREQPVAAHLRPDVYATLGQSYASLGAPDRAVAIFEDALRQCIEAAPDDVSVHVRFASLLSYALSDAGNHERAASIVQEALDRAKDDADPHNRIRLYWSIARADAIEGRPAEALYYMRKAMSLLEATDNTTQLARGYLLSAGITSREGRVAETRDHLRQAKLLLGPSPEPLDLGMLRIGQSRLAALEGDGDTAVTRARQALDTLGDFYGDSQGAAVSALAEGLALQGDAVGANDAFRRAVDLLAVHGRRHDAAESCLRWAEMLEATGRTEDAARASQRAADLGLVSDEVRAARKS
jgi:transcriptional regulator with XRE-family HTH domain